VTAPCASAGARGANPGRAPQTLGEETGIFSDHCRRNPADPPGFPATANSCGLAIQLTRKRDQPINLKMPFLVPSSGNRRSGAP
jgi:hypothetical protein